MAEIRVIAEPVVDPVTPMPAVTVGRTYAAELDSSDPGWALIAEGDDGEEQVLGPGEFEVVRPSYQEDWRATAHYEMGPANFEPFWPDAATV